jgi:hypothetical protein
MVLAWPQGAHNLEDEFAGDRVCVWRCMALGVLHLFLFLKSRY